MKSSHRRSAVAGSIAALTTAALVLTGCASSPDASGDGDGQSYEMVIGATSATGSLEVQALQRWSEAVAERTDGRLTITILPDGQLGSELETQEAIITGDVQGVSGGVTGVPQWDFLATSYVFRDADHMKAVLASDIVEPWREAWLEQSGVEIVGVFERLPRTLTSNRLVERPEDMAGLDIRVPNTEFQIALWEAVGATPVAIPSQEVYSALETGVVEAQENALDTAFAAGVGEVQDYVVLTEHAYMAQFIAIDQAFIQSLPEDLVSIMREEMSNAEDWLSDELDKAYDDILEQMQEQGAEIIEPDVDAFRDVMYPITQRYAETIWGPGVLDQITEEY